MVANCLEQFGDRNIKTTLGKKSSVAAVLGRSEDRSLEAVDNRPRKTTGSKIFVQDMQNRIEFVRSWT